MIKNILLSFLLMSSCFVWAQQEENAFQQSENRATGTTNGSGANQAQSGPTNPPGPDEVPIDDYLPALVIIGAILNSYPLYTTFMLPEKKLFPFQEIKQKLVNFCVYQDRCHAEVEQKMKEFVLIPEAKEEIILYLIKENYLNEERFAKSFTRGKFYIKKWGKNKIKQQLRLKGISDKLIVKSFSEIDERDYQDTIRDFIEKLLPTYKGLKDYQRKQKLIKFLMSKGYEYKEIVNQFQS